MNRKHILLTVTIGVVTLLLVLRFAGFKESLKALSLLDARIFLLAVAVLYSGFLLRTLRSRLLLESLSHRVSGGYLLYNIMVGWFVSSAVPARGGDLFRAYLLKDFKRIAYNDSLSVLLAERGSDILAVLGLSALFANYISSDHIPAWVLNVYLLALLSVSLLMLTLALSPQLAQQLKRLWGNAIYQRLLQFVVRLAFGLRAVVAENPSRFMASVFCTLYIWLCACTSFYLIFLGLGHPMGFAEAAFVYFTASLTIALPITPGGVGQIELVTLTLLLAVGVPKTVGVTGVLLNRLIGYWALLALSAVVTYLGGALDLLRSSKIDLPKEISASSSESQAV